MDEQKHLSNRPILQPKKVVENIDKRTVKPTIVVKPASRVKPIIKKDIVSVKKENDENKVDIPLKAVLRSSLDLEKSEESSLYVSALEDVTESVKNGLKFISKVSDILASMSFCLMFTMLLCTLFENER